jgi:hypothetical protein
MYIHLGSATVVTADSIVGIFDMDYCSISKRTRAFLKSAQHTGKVVNVAQDLPKSFVVACGDDGQTRVYISPVSTSTLRKRAGFLYE